MKETKKKFKTSDWPCSRRAEQVYVTGLVMICSVLRWERLYFEEKNKTKTFYRTKVSLPIKGRSFRDTSYRNEQQPATQVTYWEIFTLRLHIVFYTLSFLWHCSFTRHTGNLPRLSMQEQLFSSNLTTVVWTAVCDRGVDYIYFKTRND